jgi:gamma-D-glutamyl-L-lysine dipeptidyl-peptidase
MMTTIQEIIAELLRERGIDRRTCYTHVVAAGTEHEVQCSDAAVATELERRLAMRTETAPARVRALPLADMPELMLVVSGAGDVRREPAHASELVSQVIQGDPVTPLKTDGEWVLARLDDGYIGWIRDWHLRPWSAAQRDAFAARALHRIRANHAAVASAPEPGAAPVAQLVVGTAVVAGTAAVRGWIPVELADGRPGYVRRADLERIPRGRATPERLAKTGLRFLGVPYMWGGTTPNGFDCSGLVQRIFRLNGILLPRDSDMQARFGRERIVQDASQIEPGDLLFFGRSIDAITHVALVLPDRKLLHSYGQVVLNSLDTESDAYSARLASIWRLTRTPLRTRRS